MESPNQSLLPQPCFARNGCISFEIQGSKVCSTIRPLIVGHCFGFCQGTHVWKAPTSTFHHALFCQEWLISFEIQEPKVCSPIHPLTLSHCFGFFQRTHIWKAPTSAFHQSLVLPRMVASVSRSKGPKCAQLSAPSLLATIFDTFKGPTYGKPQPVLFARVLFGKEWLHQFEDPRVQSVLDYPPPQSGPHFWIVSKVPHMESPNQCLSPEPCFARNACISFEIQGSKVCSPIRPLTLRHYFGYFQRNYIWKAATGIFHQSLVLPGMVASASRSKGPKSGGLSAPSLWATILASFKGPTYGKPQPKPFTTALF